MRPITFGIEKLDGFSKRRVADTEWASATGVDGVHSAAEKVDDKVG